VNAFVDEREAPIDVLVIGQEAERSQRERLRVLRRDRDAASASGALAALVDAASGTANLIEPLVDCARARCTEGEIVQALSGVFGDYSETPRF
jgi:methylmalonyl-CoA mutase N-terminal domain/subunit